MDLVLRGGRLADGSVTDVGVVGERIAQIGGEMHAATEIDAHGKLLLPGGVDAHVHLSSPPLTPRPLPEVEGASAPLTPRPLPGVEGAPRWVDDFTSGSAAALAGGITTVGNMTFGAPDETPRQALRRETEIASRQAIADVFLHAVIGVPDEPVLADVSRLLDDGCSSIKVFMSNPRFDQHVDGYMEAIRRAGEAGLLSMVHCEDAPSVAFATRRLVESGRTSPRFFGESRPVLAEVVATQRAVAIAELTGSPIYVVHLSSRRALEVCVEARSRGVAVFVETRPLYLHLTAEVFDEPEPGRYIGQPPLRSPGDVDAVWHGLASGAIDTVCTDHAPWSLAAKLDPEVTVENVRPGVENLQLLLPMLYSEGVRTGRISLQRLVEVTSANAARLFGLYPRKGAIAVGSDADVVVFDPSLERTVTAAMLKSNADYSVYEGRQVTGWPAVTIRRGEVVFRDDVVLGTPGSGKVLACSAAYHGTT